MVEQSACILIADDEPAARVGLKRALGKNNFTIIEACDGAEALELVAEHDPALLILDLNMPEMTGMEVLQALAGRADKPRVIVLTAHGSERIAIEAMKKGASDYLAKPYELEELRLIVSRELEASNMARENSRLRQVIDESRGLGTLIGSTPIMQKLFNIIEKVSGLDVTVLIQGESGTGKELVARELHDRSCRAAGPFIAVNCAALPDALIESELFGHLRGAFTGAAQDRKGKFELAHTGTIFLDEIGDMNPAVQAKLLRVLETTTIEPLGSPSPIAVDVRVISASHRDLAEQIREGGFREDLYYRIKVVDVEIPPLRERRADIPDLVRHFLQQLCAKHGCQTMETSKEAMQMLHGYSWPGNVRELKNILEKALILASGDGIEASDLPNLLHHSVAAPSKGAKVANMPFSQAKREVVRAFELNFIERKLREHEGNISRTAQALGIHRQSLQQKLKELGISVNRYRGD